MHSYLLFESITSLLRALPLLSLPLLSVTTLSLSHSLYVVRQVCTLFQLMQIYKKNVINTINALFILGVGLNIP